DRRAHRRSRRHAPRRTRRPALLLEPGYGFGYRRAAHPAHRQTLADVRGPCCRRRSRQPGTERRAQPCQDPLTMSRLGPGEDAIAWQRIALEIDGHMAALVR